MEPATTLPYPHQPGTEKSLLADFLRIHDSVRFFHYHWVDFSGILRVRVFTRTHCQATTFKGWPLRLPASSLGPGADEYESPDMFTQIGADCHYPDWSSLRIFDSERHHASVFCFVSAVKNIARNWVHTSDPYYRCPRTTLQRALDCAKSQHSLEFLVGFELEFYLLDKASSEDWGMPSDDKETSTYWSTASSLRTVQGECVEDCAYALQSAGIMVEQFHAEGSEHQFEIATGPLDALEAVDAMILSQEIIKRTAAKRGMQATFLPKPFSNRSSSGLHAHLSIKNASVEVESHFLAGILHRLPLLCAFGMPNEASYTRLGWPMLGEWVAWGTENRDCPIRRIDSCHWEIRTLDATANPYIALSAFLAAGVNGVGSREALTWEECLSPIGSMQEQDRRGLGITDRLPSSMGESIDKLEQDTMGLGDILGEEFLGFYKMLKNADRRKLAEMNVNARRNYFQKEF